VLWSYLYKTRVSLNDAAICINIINESLLIIVISCVISEFINVPLPWLARKYGLQYQTIVFNHVYLQMETEEIPPA